jgi:diguanylate cyclase (GGDEF)-like protein/PAS domain S-box-containing protein
VKNKHVGLRLGVAFAVLIALLAGIGQFGLRRMQTIDETLGEITGKLLTDLELTRRALAISNDNNRIVMQIVLVKDRALIETLLATRSDNSKEITRLVEESERRCDSEKEKQLLSTVKRARKPYVESYLRAIHLHVDEGKHDAAEAALVNETFPALLRYHAAWNEFVDFQKNEVDVAVQQAQIDYIKARRLAYLLIVLAVAVALAIALFTTRQTAREIAMRIDAQKEGSKLSAGLEERVMQRTSELSEAVKRLNLQAAALEAAANAIVITDFHGTIMWVNHAFTTMTGYSNEEVLGQNPRMLKSGEQPDNYYAEMWSTISLGKVWQGELVNRRKDGTTYTEEMTITPIAQNVGQANWSHFIAIKQDITERKRAEEELYRAHQMLQTILNTIPQRVFWKDRNCTYVGCNRAFATEAGLNNPAEIIGKSDFELAWSGTADRYRADDKLVMEQGSAKLNFDETQSRPDGSLLWLRTNKLPLWDREGKVIGVIGTHEDITERKVAEERVQYLAYYDALTGLPNRTLLQDRLTKALASARRRKDKVALLFLDLDGFKTINDSLGHSVGDLVLKQVAERLMKWAREQDTVARVGGDEFLIVLTSVKDIPDAAVAAERLMNTMTAAYVVQGHSLGISCSLGISIFPEHGADSETLIKDADAAMYCAKENGCNNFRFFTKDMNAQAVERLTLENGLRLALEKKELFLAYQPQMDIATRRVTGLEALLRWQHPELGLVPPDKFIRIAENSGLIVPIGEWVLRTACSQTRKWQDEGLLAVPVAVNVSAVQFRQASFCELIGRVLRETGLAPQYLELELTESLLLSNAHVTFTVLQDLRAMGVKLAIDDFGTGYSSLSYLKQFPVGKLKIDRSFIRDVAVNPDDAAITTAIISMARSLSLKVIAEGVEDEAQMTFLRAHQCDEIQGYYFSKPLAVDKVADKLRGDHPEAKVLAQASGGTIVTEDVLRSVFHYGHRPCAFGVR